MPRIAVALLAAAALFAADTAPVQLVNEGKPMRAPFQCPADDIQALGLDCSEDEPCPVYLELSAVDTVGQRLFLAGNIHTSSATLSSILLATADDGKTWTEPHPRIRFSALDQIQFIDFANGWISGASIQATPRDPFFLVTNNGGKTWRERPLFEESRPGVIERFWFDSAESGSLTVVSKGTGYELYESRTGGDSWTLLQVSHKPLQLPRARPNPDPRWRVRADRGNHSYVVETRDGSAWKSIAAFLVDLGSCK